MDFIDRVRTFFEMPTRAERDRKKLNVKLDAQLFMTLCHTLHKEAPKEPLLMLDARRTPDESKTYELECLAHRSTGKDARMALSAEAEATIGKALDELFASMKQQKQPPWKGLKLTVDVPGDKYNVDFRY